MTGFSAGVPLLTSLPPRLNRRDRNGTDIGAAYQRACIESWVGCGFHPVSVNPPEEIPALAAAFPQVSFVVADSNGQGLYGRPVVFLNHLLRQAEGEGAPAFAIINADILLTGGPSMAARLADMACGGGGRCVLAHRFDRPHLDPADPGAGAEEGAFYTIGFDLFVMETARAGLFGDDVFGADGFAMGIPWWDYWVPLRLKLAGVPVSLLTDPVVQHLDHDKHWNPQQWRAGYRLIARHVRRLACDAAGGQGPAAFAAGLLDYATGFFDFGDRYPEDDPRGRDIVDQYLTCFSEQCVRFILNGPDSSKVSLVAPVS